MRIIGTEMINKTDVKELEIMIKAKHMNPATGTTDIENNYIGLRGAKIESGFYGCRCLRGTKKVNYQKA